MLGPPGVQDCGGPLPASPGDCFLEWREVRSLQRGQPTVGRGVEKERGAVNGMQWGQGGFMKEEGWVGRGGLFSGRGLRGPISLPRQGAPESSDYPLPSEDGPRRLRKRKRGSSLFAHSF